MTDNVLDIALLICFLCMLIAMLLAFVRLVRGPSMYDRIAAMDLIASVTMGFILVYSIVIQKSMYVDIAIVISLISFIGTVAISTYLRLNSKKDE
ncbi:monovalent cation/H+ antiporter complex subunit F [Carboxylicivirga sp. RSCT41]|uniref:monovalent cation/H+ antiporter complex subunit F n=1 Tax=Carboxylicivirga agarovorans TaxID=3417570 RepID=UPI003D33B269